jgi:hypothetical protein
VLALLVVLGCAAPRWHRPDSTEADLAADEAECTALSGNTSGVSNLYTSRFVARCLEERGWTRAEAPPESAPAAVAVPASPDEPSARSPSFETCFERCRTLTDRTKEQCFDTCLAAEAR